MNDVIRRAADVVGSQAKLAEAIGVTPQAVSQWVRGHRPVPAGAAPAIERATSGQVTRAELRPDIFGDLEGARDAA